MILLLPAKLMLKVDKQNSSALKASYLFKSINQLKFRWTLGCKKNGFNGDDERTELF